MIKLYLNQYQEDCFSLRMHRRLTLSFWNLFLAKCPLQMAWNCTIWSDNRSSLSSSKWANTPERRKIWKKKRKKVKIGIKTPHAFVSCLTSRSNAAAAADPHPSQQLPVAASPSLDAGSDAVAKNEIATGKIYWAKLNKYEECSAFLKFKIGDYFFGTRNANPPFSDSSCTFGNNQACQFSACLFSTSN